jgi:amino-acid N-acetyltransferase
MPDTLPVFRAATAKDRAAIEVLLVSNGLPVAGVAELLAEDPTSFVVAQVGGQLVATAALEACGEHALLRSVAVSETLRTRGLGRALVEQVVAQATTRGIDGLYLLTMTAEAYFPRFGFARVERAEVPPSVARTLEFTSACPATAVAMHKSLRNPS